MSSIDSTLLVAAECDVGLLVDFGERGVESLRVVIVEDTWVSVVLTSNHDQ